MLSRFAKVLLVSSSVAPVLLTWAFADYRRIGSDERQAAAVGIALGLVLLCVLVLTGSRKMLPHVSFNAVSLKTADTEVVGFIVAYLLPLVTTGTDQLDYVVLIFITALLGLIVWSTNAYSVNPLLSLMGYHFYELSNSRGVTYLFLSKRDLHNCDDITNVVQLARYVLLDTEKNANG